MKQMKLNGLSRREVLKSLSAHLMGSLGFEHHEIARKNLSNNHLWLLSKVIWIITIAISTLGCTQYQTKEKFIRPDNEKIYIKGALFQEKESNKVRINRHNKEFLVNEKTFTETKKANTQSGVSICFTTNSNKITVCFEGREDALHRHCVFGIFKNGEFYKKADSLVFSFTNPENDKYTDWRIVLPVFYGVDFTGIRIDKKAKLKEIAQTQKLVYMAIGNSITHGVGQNGAGYLTYPFLLAEQKGWQLYNLAVGGSKISWPIAQLTENIRADIITILWGYNDWNSSFTIKDEIHPYYQKLLTGLRRVQPDAKIYCILPTFSKRRTPRIGKSTLDDIRNCQLGIVTKLQKEGDHNLFVINGKRLTSEDDLTDEVHFSVKGAERFAASLGAIIN